VVTVNQCSRLGDIVPVSCSQQEAQGIAQAVHNNVDFGGESTATAA
jgi:hypothetical protein